MSGFGVANYTSGSTKKNFRIKWGDQTYRVLPPYGSLRFDGKWEMYYRVHWGAGVIGSDGKFSHRPFLCVEEIDYSSRKILSPCPACEEIRAKKEEYDALESQLKAEGLEKEEIREKLSPLTAWLKKYNVNGQWYMNVMNTEGEVGTLAIPSRMRSHLRTAIKDLVEKGYDPLSTDKGFWFVFSRTRDDKGQALHSVHVRTVDVQLENGEIATVTRPSSLSEDQLKTALAGCRDLAEEPPAIQLTYDQISSVVRSGYDTEVVEAVIGAARKEESVKRYSNGARVGSSSPAPVEDFSESKTESAPQNASEQAPEAAPASNNSMSEAELIRKQIAEMEARLRQTQTEEKPATPEAETPESGTEEILSRPMADNSGETDFSKMSTEDFINYMNARKK